MDGRFLLDTNIIIALFAKDTIIHERIVNAEEILLPSIAMQLDATNGDLSPIFTFT